MLQPVQLQQVSERFPIEIASLRRFLSDAGITVGSSAAAGEIVTKIVEDRSFHRDLMSHVWVALDDHNSELRYPELLGILAIAVAGPNDASSINEEDAHALLRFLMQAKHAFDGPATKPLPLEREKLRVEVTPTAAAKPERQEPLKSEVNPIRNEEPAIQIVPRETNPEATSVHGVELGTQIRPDAVLVQSVDRRDSAERRDMPQRSADSSGVESTQPDATHAAEPKSSPLRHWRRLAVAVGLAVLIVSLFMIFHRHHSAEPGEVTEATSEVGATVTAKKDSISSGNTGSTVSERSPSYAETDRNRPGVVSPSRQPASRLPSHSFSVSPSNKSTPAPIVREPSAEAAAPASSQATRSALPSGAPTSNGPQSGPPRATLIPDRTLRAPGKIAAVPADSLSRQLDSPRFPAYMADADDVAKKKYPKLLRRHASDADTVVQGSDPQLTAELHAPDLPGTLSRGSTSGSSVRGNVTSTCLGMMAGNLVYSPTPSYPASAAAARVQGEVKIQATVDRDGTINNARVISGPPPLRDAALAAVEHWRFKPFFSAGKATPAAALAVLEFELQ